MPLPLTLQNDTDNKAAESGCAPRTETAVQRVAFLSQLLSFFDLYPSISEHTDKLRLLVYR